MNSLGKRASACMALASCQCLAFVLLSACGARPIKTHTVKGRVELKDGEVSLLTGSHVELMVDSDTLLRPGGKIDSSGAFAIETLYQGKVLPGAPPGQLKGALSWPIPPTKAFLSARATRSTSDFSTSKRRAFC